MQRSSPLNRNLYAETANALIPCSGLLKGDISCDVCIIGAEISGITAALEIAKKGLKVVILEAKKIHLSSLSKNSGEITRTLPLSPKNISKKFGRKNAETLCMMNLEGSDYISWFINENTVNCDLKLGHLFTVSKGKDIPYLDDYIDDWEEMGCENIQIIDRIDIKNFINSRNYAGGLYDPKGITLHPLNYALEIIKSAQKNGCKVYEQTSALFIEETPKTLKIHTSGGGKVKAKFVIMAGNIQFQSSPEFLKKSLKLKNFTIASEDLDDYFLSGIKPEMETTIIDRDILSCSISVFRNKKMLIRNIGNSPNELKEVIEQNFPETSKISLDYFWTDTCHLTLNQLPNIGKLGKNIFYANSYGEYGIAFQTSIGKTLAEAVTKTSEKLDFLSKIKHTSIPSNDFGKKILLNLYDLWFKIR